MCEKEMGSKHFITFNYLFELLLERALNSNFEWKYIYL